MITNIAISTVWATCFNSVMKGKIYETYAPLTSSVYALHKVTLYLVEQFNTFTSVVLVFLDKTL